ncbi:MAG: hypothetical protein VYE58_07155 [Pseudomonadota bacterium]|nr:hypothetical protein [Pseudomonadota bacterium]
MRSFGFITPGREMAQRLDIAQINIIGFVVLVMFAALLAAAIIDPPSENRVPKISEADRRVTAVHESGHAVLAALLPAGGDIAEITIKSRWGILGSLTRAPAAESLSDAERWARKMAELVIAQAGLVAEELILDADRKSNAMTAAEKIAFDLLGGEAANLSVAEADAGVRRLMEEAERRARIMLAARGGEVERLADILLESGTLNGGQVTAIVAGE